MKTLKEYWNKYFSKETPDSKGGWGAETERNVNDKERRKEFKINIIDNFVEGECFVIFN